MSPSRSQGPQHSSFGRISEGGLTRFRGEQGAPGAPKDCRIDAKAWVGREEQQGCRGSSPPVEKYSRPCAREHPSSSPLIARSTPKGVLTAEPKGSQKSETPVHTGPSRRRGQERDGQADARGGRCPLIHPDPEPTSIRGGARGHTRVCAWLPTTG